MVQRNEVDMAVNSISMTHALKKVMDFSYPYDQDAIAFLSQKPGYLNNKDEVLIWSFTSGTWSCSIASCIVFTLAFYVIVFLDNELRQPKDLYYNSIFNILLESVKQFANATLAKWPQKWLPKIILLLWCLLIFILSRAYAMALFSNLTKPMAKPPIDSIPQLLASEEHFVVFFNGYYQESMFKESQDTHFQNVHKKFLSGGGVKIHWSEYKQMLLEEPRAVIPVNRETSRLRSVIGWGLPREVTFAHWSKQTVFPFGYAIALQKGSNLKACLDKW